MSFEFRRTKMKESCLGVKLEYDLNSGGSVFSIIKSQLVIVTVLDLYRNSK